MGGEDGLGSNPSLTSPSHLGAEPCRVIKHRVLITVVRLLFDRGSQEQNLTLHEGEGLNSSQEAQLSLSRGATGTLHVWPQVFMVVLGDCRA